MLNRYETSPPVFVLDIILCRFVVSRKFVIVSIGLLFLFKKCSPILPMGKSLTVNKIREKYESFWFGHKRIIIHYIMIGIRDYDR